MVHLQPPRRLSRWLHLRPQVGLLFSFYPLLHGHRYGQLGVALSLDILEGRRVVYTLHSSGCVSTYPQTSIVNATPLFQPSELDQNAIQAIVMDAKLNPLAQTQVYNPEHDTHSVYKAKLSARLKRLTFNVEATQQSLSHDLQKLYAKIKNKDSTVTTILNLF